MSLATTATPELETRFTFDKDYDNLAQVEHLYPAYLARRAALESAGRAAPGGVAYNDDFRGHIATGDEDTAIYLLQGMHYRKTVEARRAALIADGARPVPSLTQTTRYARVYIVQLDRRGGSVRELVDVRLVPNRHGRVTSWVEKGKRNGYAVKGELLTMDAPKKVEYVPEPGLRASVELIPGDLLGAFMGQRVMVVCRECGWNSGGYMDRDRADQEVAYHAGSCGREAPFSDRSRERRIAEGRDALAVFDAAGRPAA